MLPLVVVSLCLASLAFSSICKPQETFPVKWEITYQDTSTSDVAGTATTAKSKSRVSKVKGKAFNRIVLSTLRTKTIVRLLVIVSCLACYKYRGTKLTYTSEL
jgi:hypothetical protein